MPHYGQRKEKLLFSGSKTALYMRKLLDRQCDICIESRFGCCYNKGEQRLILCNELGKTESFAYVPLTKERLDMELEKGMVDIREGRVYSADEVEAEIRAYSGTEILAEVQASMAMEGMELTDEDISMLKKVWGASKEKRNELIKGIIEEYKET